MVLRCCWSRHCFVGAAAVVAVVNCCCCWCDCWYCCSAVADVVAVVVGVVAIVTVVVAVADANTVYTYVSGNKHCYYYCYHHHNKAAKTISVTMDTIATTTKTIMAYNNDSLA